jgi:hypothetical protein
VIRTCCALIVLLATATANADEAAPVCETANGSRYLRCDGPQHEHSVLDHGLVT